MLEKQKIKSKCKSSKHFAVHYVQGRFNEDSLTRPFMSNMGGRVGTSAIEAGLNSTIGPSSKVMKFAGKDTAESQAWDGTMAFDSVYSERHTLKDTASNVVLAG